MEYRVFGNDIVLRIQKGEDIPTVLQAVCEKEQVKLASVSGLGAVGEVTLGICHGGHVNRAIVSLTGEFILHRIDGQVEREYSPEVGLNLFKFVD